MSLPVQKHQRPWRWMVVLGLFCFAAGLLAGPWVHDQTYAFFNQAGPKLAARMPRLFGWLGPAPSSPVAPVAHTPAPAPTAPVAQPRSPVAVAPTVTPVPAAAPAAEPAAERRRASAHAASHAQPARTSRSPSAAKSAGATKSPPVAEAPAPSKAHNPFDTDSTRAAARKPAGRSSDSLDNLMAGVVPDGKGKPKKHEKDIDEMLKDVQKSRPAPAAKRVEAPALEPLTASDIAKAMAGVKTRATACAQRLGQSGIAALKITVGKDGRVTNASVGGKLAGTPLGGCIEKAVRATTFRPNAGLRFDYRIEAH